ncbi:pilus assembly protein PilP [Steroidobacter sp. S1-65]|uniref:Pilus assembly protein PilP n=1 Tax=Steroidobacter gossypii TaxID=2805490 RepID=A0ABS1WSX3_9GAMM|nr:pilus assembly protein PilP [Steroidobacter gossypii]MBM0104060.1 pilus assembly protein PilP [Steroidobacter gossypii]
MTVHSTHLRSFATGALALLWLSGCSTDMDKLQAQVAEIKNSPGERIEPLPEIKAYESFTYNASNLRSPFVPSAPARNDVAASVRPDSKRTREFLEQFPLDTMQMVGTLQLQGRNFGLVQGKDGLVHRVLPGNFMGQNDGRVVSITPTRISIIEIVPDGLGGYIERPAALALNE